MRNWITAALICSVPLTWCWMLTEAAAEVQLVHFGSTVALSCNVSYLYDTTWLKQSPDLPPTVVLSASLRNGQLVEVFRLGPRYSASLMNRSLALSIAAVEEGDLGLYYCIANTKTRVIVGKGTRLYAPDSSGLQFQHWYFVAVGSGLLIMILVVCITHWRTRQRNVEEHQPIKITSRPSSH